MTAAAIVSGTVESIAASLVKVNTGTNAVSFSADTAVGIVRFYNNNLYVTGGYLGISSVRVLSTTDFSAVKTNFVSDGTTVINPYGLDIDPSNGDVYVGDATNDYTAPGTVFCFDKTGTKKFSFSTTPTSSPIKTVLVQK